LIDILDTVRRYSVFNPRVSKTGSLSFIQWQNEKKIILSVRPVGRLSHKSKNFFPSWEHEVYHVSTKAIQWTFILSQFITLILSRSMCDYRRGLDW
jgi:hypothetical protein